MNEETLKEIEGCVAESYERAQNGSGPITVAETHRAALVAEVRRLRDGLDYAWGIIANASGGDWTKETKDWQEAAARWRDEHYHRVNK